ncbi:MAG: hypothetical protein IKY70_01870 [Bacteroidales bacterium]|nr:hypothetical protein [Bacteroidales bacterium]
MITYREESSILWHNVDLRQEIKPYAFLNLTQEIAGNHANRLNFGYNDLKECEQTWVLSRIKVRYNNYPKWQDKITLETWHKGMQSLFGLRDFALLTEEGSQAIVATSSWLIMNSKTRRIERDNNFYNNPEILKQANPRNAIEEPCDRLKSQKEMELKGEHIVKYSDLDALGHTNNAKYAEWTTDCIDSEILENYRIKEFQINFNAETRLGEQIELWLKEIDTPENICTTNNITKEESRTVYIEGKREGKSVCEAIFTFVPLEICSSKF